MSRRSRNSIRNGMMGMGRIGRVGALDSEKGRRSGKVAQTFRSFPRRERTGHPSGERFGHPPSVRTYLANQVMILKGLPIYSWKEEIWEGD
jgi:hypothetical protein